MCGLALGQGDRGLQELDPVAMGGGHAVAGDEDGDEHGRVGPLVENADHAMRSPFIAAWMKMATILASFFDHIDA
eukprot:7751767-Alexandrium_andersonii.AAC.1